ncbi:MAG: hypothetical protein O2856_16785 [Planctomycetota bacterium]|nr:hypothetical protein [Planctomycetota bacterium]
MASSDDTFDNFDAIPTNVATKRANSNSDNQQDSALSKKPQRVRDWAYTEQQFDDGNPMHRSFCDTVGPTIDRIELQLKLFPDAPGPLENHGKIPSFE